MYTGDWATSLMSMAAMSLLLVPERPATFHPGGSSYAILPLLRGHRVLTRLRDARV